VNECELRTNRADDPEEIEVPKLDQLRARDRAIATSRSELLLHLLDEQEKRLREQLVETEKMREMVMLIAALSRS
jgi:anaerobic glycerol-3-phosphate dehydrogenase